VDVFCPSVGCYRCFLSKCGRVLIEWIAVSHPWGVQTHGKRSACVWRERGKEGARTRVSSSARGDEAPKVMELRDGFLCQSWSLGEELAW
jgi:hypothetical protein